MAMEFDENKSRIHDPGHSPSFYTPDMASALDTHVDQLVEKHGFENEKLIRAIAKDLQGPMNEEISKNQALTLGRVACYLAKSEKNNVLARIHALLHSIPRLATMVGFSSMRKSAIECRVSCEWIRRSRDRWCEILELPVPADGRKSEEAKEKYHLNGTTNHWRTQRYQNQTKPNLPCPIPKPTKLTPRLATA